MTTTISSMSGCLCCIATCLQSIPWVMLLWYCVSFAGLVMVEENASTVKDFIDVYQISGSGKEYEAIAPFLHVSRGALAVNTLILIMAVFLSGATRECLCGRAAGRKQPSGVQCLALVIETILFLGSWVFCILGCAIVALGTSLFTLSFVGGQICDQNPGRVIELVNRFGFDLEETGQIIDTFCFDLRDLEDTLRMLAISAGMVFLAQFNISISTYAFAAQEWRLSTCCNQADEGGGGVIHGGGSSSGASAPLYYIPSAPLPPARAS